MRRTAAALAWVAVTTVMTVMTACQSETPASGKPEVVAGFYPLYEAATRVGGDRVHVTNLTSAGTEPHDLELSSRQIDRIEDASVVLYLGQGFQPAIERAAKRAKGTKVDLLADDAGDDPHVWLDPIRYKAMVNRVAEALSAADPANRATYEANAAAYGRELDALDTDFAEGLSRCDRRVIVTSHDAFGYLARRYGLTQEAISGLEPESEPSPRRLSELVGVVRATGTTTVFYETLVSPDVARSLAREAGVTTAVLDPIEGLVDPASSYLSVIRDNLAALRQALGCR